MSSNKNKEIEVLRAIAITMVIMAHLIYLLPWGAEWITTMNTYTYFWGGVDIFFVISGFLITKSIMKDNAQYENKRNFIAFYKRFLLRRFYRLIPTSWFWAFFSVLIAIVYNRYGSFGDPLRNFIDAVGNVFYVSNLRGFYCPQGIGGGCGINGKLWSLSLEEQFYFLFPVLIFILRKNISLFLALIIVVQLPIERIPGDFLWFFRTDAIAWGCLLAIFSKSKCYNSIKPLIFRAVPLRMVAIIGMLLLNIILARGYFTPVYVGGIALSSAFLVWVASYNENLLFDKVSNNKVVLWIASRSYSIYLCHGFGFFLITESMKNFNKEVGVDDTLTVLVLGLLMVCILSELSYRLIEQKFIKLGRKRNPKQMLIKNCNA